MLAIARLDVPGSSHLLDGADHAGSVEAPDRFAGFVRARFDTCGSYALDVTGDRVSAALATPVLAVDSVRQLQ
jgi:hypothetical protein